MRMGSMIGIVCAGLLSLYPLKEVAANPDIVRGGGIDAEFWNRTGRPADVYRLAVDNDPAVCRAMIDALNQPIMIPEPYRSDYRRTIQNDHGGPPIANKRYWYSALITTLSVDWQPLHFWHSAYNMERTLVDLDHNGHEEAVYRQLITGPGSAYFMHIISRTEHYDYLEDRYTPDRHNEIIAEKYPEKQLAGQRFPIRKGMPKATLYINIDGLPDGLPAPDFVTGGRHEAYKEIVEIDGDHYILLLRQDYYQGQPFSVHLLRLIDNMRQKRLCRFDSQYVIGSLKG